MVQSHGGVSAGAELYGYLCKCCPQRSCRLRFPGGVFGLWRWRPTELTLGTGPPTGDLSRHPSSALSRSSWDTAPLRINTPLAAAAVNHQRFYTARTTRAIQVLSINLGNPPDLQTHAPTPARANRRQTTPRTRPAGEIADALDASRPDYSCRKPKTAPRPGSPPSLCTSSAQASRPVAFHDAFPERPCAFSDPFREGPQGYE